jgi:RHS repeat-associated protein
VTTFFAYDALGRLGAESATSGVAAAGVNFITQDHLGSTRLVTNAAGSVIGRHDFLPFGEEIPASIGNRNAIAGYNAADSVRHKYTGKERDPESGLDFFQARYDSSPQGRFTSVDPEINWGNNPIDPQRWNHYAYVADRPLIYVDPDGMDAVYRLVMTFAFGPGYVQEHGDRSTLDILLARETVAQTAQGAQVFRQEHQEITHGFSPVPTTSTDGVLLIGALRPLKIGGQVISAIGKDKKLVALAEEAGPAVQRGLDSLVKQLAAGNLNPGIGTKHLFGDIFYARSRDGARVFFRQVGDKIEILGKAAKKNEEEVIRRLTELYKGPK